MDKKTIELPRLTLEQKWQTAEENLIYFVVSGIAFAKSMGKSPEDFGTFAGVIAVTPSWGKDEGKGPQALVAGISRNKQQFRDFQLEILSESETMVEAKMKGFGENDVRHWLEPGVTVDDYLRFFDRKWIAIADHLGLEYKQRVEGDWIVFTVTEKR
ncbi:MAG: hypothetical protein NT169_07700 [Chloroflexi bacterium]|nr:hypothetical protein [Chloroflexota bacterium]